MPWEIYCHQMNFRFWNHNQSETVVIDFLGHGLSATFTLFPDTTNWYHGLLWQLNNHLYATDNSSLMLSQRMDVFWFIHTVSIRAFKHFIKLKRAIIEMMGMKRKTSMHSPSVNADLLDSMKMIVQFAKKSVIQMFHVLKQNKGWQTADSPCPKYRWPQYRND